MDRAELASKYNLARFYNPFVGNIVILEREYTDEVAANVRKFLKDNPDWLLGYEKCDEQVYGYYLNTLEDLKNW